MKKAQAFTLVEVLIASFIFMVVATVGAASLSMMRKTSVSSSDLSLAGGCARELEDFVRPQIQQGQFGDKFYGINISGNYSVKDIPVQKKPSDLPENYAGLVILKSKNEAALIVKTAGGVYQYAEVKEVDTSDKDTIQDKLNGDLKLNGIQSDSCVAFNPAESPEKLVPFGLNFAQPFNVTKKSKNNGLYSRIVITDFDFSKSLVSQGQAIERQSYAKIFIDALAVEGGV